VTNATYDAHAPRRRARFRLRRASSRRGRAFAPLFLLTLATSLACDNTASSTPSTAPSQRTVVVFTAHDRVFSEPILHAFEQRTGITVLPVYDAEAAKTTGLINRLLARGDNPECDVLWNNEVVQTEALAQAGLLEPYRSPSAERIPARYRDRHDRWTGFAGRLRVFVYNKTKFPLTEPPATLAAFTDPAYRGQGVIALPYYGTTFTHVAVLNQRLGPERLKGWLERARDNGTAFAPGNGAACDLVATGERAFGLTDTDDARGAQLEGKPIAVAIPDAAGDGAILIPNTVAFVKGAPHPAEAKELIDYLLSAEVERQLAEMPSAQIPLGTDLGDVKTPWDALLKEHPPRELPVEEIARSRTELIEVLRDMGLGR
jgi:iron(III) transport system substrate-binding protein